MLTTRCSHQARMRATFTKHRGKCFRNGLNQDACHVYVNDMVELFIELTGHEEPSGSLIETISELKHELNATFKKLNVKLMFSSTANREHSMDIINKWRAHDALHLSNQQLCG